MEDLKELKELAENLTVLYVEDDIDIANTMVSYLSKFFKEVIYATNGEDGLKLFKQSVYDLVITDIKMPKMSGLDMTFEIKNMKKEQTVIVVSAYSEVENFLSAIKLGVEGYIIKPINFMDMNNLLYKMSRKITIEKEITGYQLKLKELVSEIKRKNQELEEYINALGKVATVSKTDLNGNIIYVNDFFCEISKYSKDELINRNHNIIRHPDVSKDIFKELWNTIQSGNVWEGTLKNKAKDGEAYYVHLTVIPLFDEEKIDEYLAIGFLSTKEEMEKREFKKNVMMSYKEFRKQNFDANKKIELLEKELESYRNNSAILRDTSHENKQKEHQLKSQIAFYEKEMANVKSKNEKLIESYKSNINTLTELNKKSATRIESTRNEAEFYKKEHETSKKEILRLEDELSHQKKVIHDLRDTIKNIVKEEDEQTKDFLHKKITDLTNLIK